MLGLHYCMWALSSRSKQGLLFVVAHNLLTAFQGRLLTSRPLRKPYFDI